MGLPEERNASCKNSEEAAELERKFGGKSLFHSLKFYRALENAVRKSHTIKHIGYYRRQRYEREYVNLSFALLHYSAYLKKKNSKNGNWSVGKELSISKLKSIRYCRIRQNRPQS